MAAYNGMSQKQLRNELKGRGLMVRGTVSELRTRLAADDAFGPIDCFFGTVSDGDMTDMCTTRFIPIITQDAKKVRVEIFKKIVRYNVRKGGPHTPGGWCNSGLPTPGDRLGAQVQEPILGTPGSGIVFAPYVNYLRAYRQDHGTLENAFTFRYWRICQNQGVALHRLWPIRHADCRVE